jgi:hypothetical protein
MDKIANKNASVVVSECKEFKGSNTFGVWEHEMCYVVYSYGKHFPMYVYDAISHAWFGNYDKYSQTTSKHMSQCRPSDHWAYKEKGIIYKPTSFLNNLIYDGVASAIDKS